MQQNKVYVVDTGGDNYTFVNLVKEFIYLGFAEAPGSMYYGRPKSVNLVVNGRLSELSK